MLKPRIFVSAVSSEFGAVRRAVAEILTRLGYEPELQNIFGTESGDLRDVLRRKIDDCDGLIQIVGAGYGAEPLAPDAEFGRVSYTQFEFLYARQRGKKTWLLFPADSCTRDTPVDRLDLPPDAPNAEAGSWQGQRRELQQAYIAGLRQSGHLWYEAGNDDRLALTVERLGNEFATLRKRFAVWQRRVALVLLAILVLLGGGIAIGWRNHLLQQRALAAQNDASARQQKSLQDIKANQVLTRQKIRAHCVEVAEAVRRDALAKAEKLPISKEREKAKDAAKRAYMDSLAEIDRIDDMVARVEGTAEATSVFNELIRVLNDEDVNAALAYLGHQRGGDLSRALALREDARAVLRPHLIGAGLKAVNGRFDDARRDYQELLAAEENWPDLLEAYAWFLFTESHGALTDGSLAAAVVDANLALQLSERLNANPSPTPPWQRVFSASLTQAGDTLLIRGQPADAEAALKHYIRSLEICEALLKANAGSGQAARDVSVNLNKLGGFLARRGQSGDAEAALAHYTRSLELDEGLLKANAGSGEAARDVSISLEKLGDFLASRGQPGDTEAALEHYTRSLEFREGLLKANPASGQAARDVSVTLEKRGGFLARRGQPGDAEAALKHYTRSLELDEGLLKANPASGEAVRDVSGSLLQLGDFLASRGHPGDAEAALKHYTRSLELLEKLLNGNPGAGEAARDVSISLHHLGDFLANRRQPGDTEAAFKHNTRSLELCEKLLEANPGSGEGARDVSLRLDRLGDFLASRGQPGDAEAALKHYTRSLELRETVLTANPGSGEAARDVSISLHHFGDFLANRRQPGDADAAFKHNTRSLELCEKLLEANPGSGEAASDVSASLHRLGDFLASRGQPGDAEAALKHYTRSLELSETLLKANPVSGEAVRGVSLSLDRLGHFFASRDQPGDAETALKHYTRSLELSETLLKANPGSGQAACDVSMTLNHLGDFLASRGQPGDAEAALKYYTRNLELSDSLLKADPGMGAAVRDVVVSHFKLAAYFAKARDGEAAKRHRRACYDLLRPRISTGTTFDPPIMQFYETLRKEFDGKE